MYVRMLLNLFKYNYKSPHKPAVIYVIVGVLDPPFHYVYRYYYSCILYTLYNMFPPKLSVLVEIRKHL